MRGAAAFQTNGVIKNMARTTKSDVLIPEIFTEAVQGRFAQKNLFMAESALARSGAVVVNDTFTGDAKSIGNEVEVPYFGSIGEFATTADGVAAAVNKLQQTSEKATVVRDTLAFEATRWSKSSKGKDAYEEAADQTVDAAARAMDRRLIGEAVKAGGLRKAVYSSSSPVFLDYDLMVDAKMMWGDEQDDVVGMGVHSATLADLYKLRDANGRPLLSDPREGDMMKFMGVPIVTSDSLPLTGSTMGAVTEVGTTPPDIAITTNTPLGPWKLRIKVHTAGARGVARIQFSVDGGENYSDSILTAASIDLVDPAIDSLIGVNGKTGLTISYENATANADNTWSSNASLKVRSVLLKKAALAFWFNREALKLQTDKDILVDSDLGAMHLYSAPLRYRRRPGGTKSGIVVIEHNVRMAP